MLVFPILRLIYQCFRRNGLGFGAMVSDARHILVIEDDAEGLRRGLTGDYVVMTVDRMLPRIDGVEVIRRLRENGVATPALILSALGEVDDRVRGLRAGGDDYLVKPFAS